MAARISVVINTLDAEAELPAALRSVTPWADEVVVVDMQSTDRTAEIARAAGAIVHGHERAGFVEPARAFAVARASGDWILILDADEVVPGTLAARLRSIAARSDVDVVVLPRRNWIFGAPMRGGGWAPGQDAHARFFRPGALRLPTRIHGALAPEPGRRVLDLRHEPDAALVHFNYVNVAQFLARLDRYTTVEARLAAEDGRRPSWARTALRGVREFTSRMFRLAGWRDGWRGVALAGLMAHYHFVTEVKLREIRAGASAEEIRRRYAEAAERLVPGPGPDSAGPEHR